MSNVFLSGCSYFTRPLDQPVIEQKLNKSLFYTAKIGTLSLTPERRVVLVNFSNNRFCAEAPTEVGMDTSRLLKFAAQASKGDEFKAGIEAITAAARSNAILNKRTQGMQLFLAHAYFICQMFMNEAIDEKKLIDLQLETLLLVKPLIEKEVSLMYQNQVPGNEDKKFAPFDINKALEDVEKEKVEPAPDG
jgi:hypothetical protein